LNNKKTDPKFINLHKDQNQTEIGELTSKEKEVLTKMTKGDKEAENGDQSPEAP
jgi:hypothetical protein